jgi:hypothetical protein
MAVYPAYALFGLPWGPNGQAAATQACWPDTGITFIALIKGFRVRHASASRVFPHDQREER